MSHGDTAVAHVFQQLIAARDAFRRILAPVFGGKFTSIALKISYGQSNISILILLV
jgi:hypothetical protein